MFTLKDDGVTTAMIPLSRNCLTAWQICDPTEACQGMFPGWRCLHTWHCMWVIFHEQSQLEAWVHKAMKRRTRHIEVCFASFAWVHIPLDMWLNWSLPKHVFWLKMLAHVTLYVSIMFEEQSLHVASLVHKAMKRRTHIDVCFASFAWVHVPLDMWLNWSLPKHAFWLKMLAHVTLYVSIMFEEQSRHVASLAHKTMKRRTHIEVCFASFAWVHVPLDMWLNWSLPKHVSWLKMLAHVTLYVSIMFEEQSQHVASLVRKAVKRRTRSIDVCFASFAWVHVPLDMWLNWSLPKHVSWLKMLAHVTLYVSIMFEEQSRAACCVFSAQSSEEKNT